MAARLQKQQNNYYKIYNTFKGDFYMPSGKKRKRHKMATHKRKKRLRKDRHKKKSR